METKWSKRKRYLISKFVVNKQIKEDKEWSD